MTITLYNTDKVVEFENEHGVTVPTRVWEGATISGVRIHAYIVCVAVDEDETRTAQFEAELQETRKPSPAVAAIPLRMIL